MTICTLFVFQRILISLTDTLNFVEILFPCLCGTDSDNLMSGKTLSVPQTITS